MIVQKQPHWKTEVFQTRSVCGSFRCLPCEVWSVPNTFHSAGSFRCLNARATFSSREFTSADGGPDRSRKRVKFRACWFPALVARNWAASYASSWMNWKSSSATTNTGRPSLEAQSSTFTVSQQSWPKQNTRSKENSLRFHPLAGGHNLSVLPLEGRQSQSPPAGRRTVWESPCWEEDSLRVPLLGGGQSLSPPAGRKTVWESPRWEEDSIWFLPLEEGRLETSRWKEDSLSPPPRPPLLGRGQS